ncbi:MAG: hypothetical protein P4L55_04895 [Syntrophobacteraceae bacterium]|nr:hypothetical protein [Syntrophobacteraceae bacterium]
MAKYRLLEKAFLNNRLYDPGETVELSHDSIPAHYMEPVDGAAKKRAREVGHVVGTLPDPVDQLTSITAESIGAAPQDVRSGMAATA